MTTGDVFRELAHVSAYLAVAGAGIVGVGFVRLAIGHRGLVGHLALGLMTLHAAVFVRTLYWDLARHWLPDGAWARWTEISNGVAVNVVFNALIVFGIYHSLKALKLAIPEDIRGDYTLVGAAFYPRVRVMQALGAALRWLWNRIVRHR